MVDILDHRGLPMPKKATPGPATEPQTASVGYLTVSSRSTPAGA